MEIALVADDREVRAGTHAAFLERFNIQALKAFDIETAKKYLAELPCVFFAIIDVNFDPQSGANKEGLDYARELKSQGYPAYLAAYSAYYADNPAVMSEVRSVFDGVLREAAEYQDYVDLITAAKAKKLEFIEKAALKHRDFLAVSEDDIVKFIDIHDFKLTNSKVLSDEYIDYIRSGYRIKLVEPTYGAKRIGRSFLLWSKSYEGGTYLEVYKVAALFAYGPSEQDALKMLNEIIAGLYRDSTSIGAQILNSEVWDFVRRVYEVK